MPFSTQPPTDEAVLHDALFTVMHARGLRLVEADQIIYPDQTTSPVIPAPSSHSVVYLQVLDTQKKVLASGSYQHALTRGQSPFVGVRAVPGSARHKVLDAMAGTLLASLPEL